MTQYDEPSDEWMWRAGDQGKLKADLRKILDATEELCLSIATDPASDKVDRAYTNGMRIVQDCVRRLLAGDRVEQILERLCL